MTLLSMSSTSLSYTLHAESVPFARNSQPKATNLFPE